MSPQPDRGPAHFKTIEQVNVPQGRHGKHNQIVATILSDLDRLRDASAIKIPLSELAESKEKVRSALNRATRKAGRTVATASDASFLYVWNVGGPIKKPQS
jgi:DNA helicase TIP49 (TBP-interacting protein)